MKISLFTPCISRRPWAAARCLGGLLLFLLWGYVPGQAQSFRVQGSAIYGPDNQEFIIKGTNIQGPGWCWSRDVAQDADLIARTWQFNTVRVNSTVKNGCSTSNTDSILVDAFTSRGIVVIFEAHDWTGTLPTGADLTLLKNWHTRLATKYKTNPYVWFNVMNEPGDCTPIAQTSWYAVHREVIQAIRNTGANNVVVCDGNTWGTEDGCSGADTVSTRMSAVLTYGRQLTTEFANVVFSYHIYCGWNAGGVAKMGNYLDRVRAKNLAIFVGEFGYAPGPQCVSQPATEAMYELVVPRRIGRAVWHWYGGDVNQLTVADNPAGGWRINSTTAKPTNLTWLGNRVWDDTHAANGPAPLPQAAYGGTPRPLPGTLQAEDVDTGGEGVAYHDTNPANQGGAYRPSEAVDIQPTNDAGGGHNVGWTEDGEWLEYTVNVTGGTYNLGLRVATGYAGRQIRVKLGSTTLGTVTVPNTGGWQSWQTVSLNNLALSGGNNQVLRLEFIGNSVNLNWVQVQAAVPTGQVAAGRYRLVARHSGKALDVSGYSQADGAAVVQWTPNPGAANQQWQVSPVGNGYYKLLAVHSGKALDVQGNGTANGTRVQQYTDLGSPAQRWRIEPTDGGYYKLTAECSGKALEVSNASTADWAPVSQWSYQNGLHQQWRLEPVTAARNAASQSVTATTATATLVAEPASESANLTVFPNPSHGEATLELKAQKPQSITVVVRTKTDLIGLFSVPLQEGTTTFKLPMSLPADTYYVRTTIDGKKVIFTLQVN